MNIVIPFTTLIAIFFNLPPYLVFKFLSYIKRSIYREDVAGKVVLITGASSGIGEYVAYAYAKRGARLVLAARREERLPRELIKAALVNSYDTLKIEFGSDIGITVVNPGFTESEMWYDGYLSRLHMNFYPMASTEGCAKAIGKSACRGDRHLIQPFWYTSGWLWMVICPEMTERWSCWLFITRPESQEGNTASNKNLSIQLQSNLLSSRQSETI